MKKGMGKLVRESACCLCAALGMLLAAGCVPAEEPLSPRQQAVAKTLGQWSDAIANRDIEAMWDMLSVEHQHVYHTQLTGPGGVRATVRGHRLALDPNSRTPERERERIKAALMELPDDPESMTARDYYLWRYQREITLESIESLRLYWHRDNIEQIVVEGDSATAYMKQGEPRQVHFVFRDDAWKFHVAPRVGRAIERTKDDKK